MQRILTSSIFLFCFSFQVTLASQSDKRLINGYLKNFKQYSKKLCSGRTDHTAEKLYKSYLGDGLYIPFSYEGGVDKETIQDNLDMYKKREKWIGSLEKRLKKVRSFRPYLREVAKIKKEYNDLLKVKYDFYLAKNFKDKKQISVKAKVQTNKFLKKLVDFIYKLDFYHSYNFPVDHLYLRREYDKYKGVDTKEGKKKANSVYFLRKIVEEGAVDKKKGRSDLYFRANIDNVYLRATSFKGTFLDEDLRYDIESLLNSYETVLRRGKKNIASRLKNWRVKTKKDVKYYENILSKDKKKEKLLTKLYSDKKKSRYALKTYILWKEAKAYQYWSKKEEIYQKLFALETILIHEVGRMDNSYGSERRDVIKVVLNRLNNKSYNKIGEDEPLLEYLKKLNIDQSKYPWLNVLFKQGEFSFTYFFIPASRGIFCPDMSRRAKKLRKKNLGIILQELKKKRLNFRATRYFSRASMMGRIDMTNLWENYTPINEMPGPLHKKNKIYLRLLNAKKLVFLYSFISPKGEKFEVFKFKKKFAVYDPRKKRFHEYRNPHLFKYFLKSEAY